MAFNEARSKRVVSDQHAILIPNRLSQIRRVSKSTGRVVIGEQQQTAQLKHEHSAIITRRGCVGRRDAFDVGHYTRSLGRRYGEHVGVGKVDIDVVDELIESLRGNEALIRSRRVAV